MKYTFRQSDISGFLKSPKDWLKRYKSGKGITPNEAMKFGTAEHAKKEAKNGNKGEVEIIINLNDILEDIKEKKEFANGGKFQTKAKDYLKDYDLKGNEVVVVGHLDYYDGEKIVDYKFTRDIDKFEPYKFQVRFYQWLVWEKYGSLVSAILEMNETIDLSDELLLEGKDESGLKTTGKIKEHQFKPMRGADMIKFRKNIFSTARKMIYLLENS